jgi:NAD(P)-dependent dehydrogenase (short-subunit alcohol dehydrogenase family)
MANTWDATTTAEEVASSLSSQIANKVILTTGVSPRSLGAYFVLTIAAHSPSLLILAGRNTTKSAETASAIKAAHPNVQTRILELDLSSQAQIRKAAAEVLGYEENIDVLMNNAGIMAQPYGKTVDGIESQFGCNFIGHWLFTNLIMDKINRGGRIVNVSSDGNRLGGVRFEDWNFQVGGFLFLFLVW